MTHTLPRHAAHVTPRTSGGWAPPRHRSRLRSTVPTMVRIGAIVGAVALSLSLSPAGHASHVGPSLSQLPTCQGGEAPGDAGARCVWDAVHMGNGQGRSFRINRAGELKYLSHERAHTLAYGWEARPPFN
jgi:hypothetical protein